MAAMASNRRKPRPPLDAAKLDELALSYVGRFATSSAKLKSYLARKLRERGWAGSDAPPLDALAERLTRLGYVDDRAYALAKAQSLTSKGYGTRRVRQALMTAGIGEEDSADAREHAEGEALAAAMRYARRKSLGPYAQSKPDMQARERAIAAMIRAGHGFGMARAIVDLGPGEFPESGELSNRGP